MDTEAEGEVIALVVRLEAAGDNVWHLSVSGTHSAGPYALAPLTLVVRLHRDGPTMRGTLHLHNSDLVVPIQTNTRFADLVRAWLLAG